MGLRVLAVAVAAMAAALLLASSSAPVSGQVMGGGPLGCTVSLINSFAPCLNFIISNNASPTKDCCHSLEALMKVSSGCACQILTGSIPGMPINRTMAVRLPKTCNNASVPLQCQDATTAALTPAPGPVAADAPAPTPSMAPLPPVTPAAETPEPEVEAPEAPVEPTATPPVSQEQKRPTAVPSATSTASVHVSAGTAVLLLLAVAGAALV